MIKTLCVLFKSDGEQLSLHLVLHMHLNPSQQWQQPQQFNSQSVFYSTQRAHRLRSKCHVMLKYTNKILSTKSSYLQPWSCTPLQRHIYCCLPA